MIRNSFLFNRRDNVSVDQFRIGWFIVGAGLLQIAGGLMLVVAQHV